MNVTGYFDLMRRRHPHRAALVSGIGRARRSITYLDLGIHVDRAVQRLRTSELRAGDRVLLAVPLSAETYIAMLAILKAGLVILFVDPAHGRKVFAKCLRAYPPAAIFATPGIRRLRWFSPELRRVPLWFTVNIRESNPCDRSQEVSQCAIEDPALLTFTSGSTGEPKAVVRTHGFLGKQFDMLRQVARLRDDDVDLVAMPMFVLFNLASGITSVIPACDVKRPGHANPAILASQLGTEHGTRMVASPALLERLADYCADANVQLPGLRQISTGGGPVPPTLPNRLQEIATNAEIVSVYGSTEAEPIASIDNRSVSGSDLQRSCAGAGLLAGLPVEGCDVRIIRYRHGPVTSPCPVPTFMSLVLPANCVGEIVVSGEHVLPGYANAARNAETKIEVDGTTWHRTGDAGYFDARGRLWVAGRCCAAIHDSRGTVYPFQVEYAACNLSGVRRAALVAAHGQRILAIEKKHGRDAADPGCIVANIPGVQIDKIIPLRRIPLDKRHGAKVDYSALRQRLGI